MNCPKCEADVSETYEPDDWSCGIVGGWYCDACDPQPGPKDDIGHPDHARYAEFCRIARAWGCE